MLIALNQDFFQRFFRFICVDEWRCFFNVELGLGRFDGLYIGAAKMSMMMMIRLHCPFNEWERKFSPAVVVAGTVAVVQKSYIEWIGNGGKDATGEQTTETYAHRHRHNLVMMMMAMIILCK